MGREPTDGEVAEATNMDASELRKKLEAGRAARNKLIKVLSFTCNTFLLCTLEVQFMPQAKVNLFLVL